MAVRWRGIYPAQDQWELDVSTEKETGTSQARIIVVRQGEELMSSPALLSLFWERVDYLLGNRRTWPDCVEWKQKIDKGDKWSALRPLCGMSLKKRRPADPAL